ncbi:MFS general substrate transporter [Ascodesmis nigricans]|uniref:MFS general substrate transporter n=1 Tax=Ascodesmis nigricans TaxID=341454 RepID=A0A4S2N0R5_9PEZI|nr:MFS general substrate transporter [Ascodesmis nigricans]
MTSTWAGTPSIKGSSDAVRMALLTISLSGVQLVWGIEMAYCAPYLLSLGLTKSLMSLVWNVGPISGMICQPIVGVVADRSTSRFGRRRPVIMLGSIAVAMALFVLGWTKEIVGLFFEESDFAKRVTIVLAVLAIYLVDFAINAVQACCRALIVDTLPQSQQQHGSAWASRMIAVGNIAGYFAGMVDLVGIFGKTFGDTQFKQLMVVSAVLLMICVGITCFSVTERVLISRKAEGNQGILAIFKTIWSTLFNLPSNIRAICIILFWAWIGWFPFQVYSTTFVGEVLKRYDTGMRSQLSSTEDQVGAITRVGSMALVLFSCMSLAASVTLPWIIVAPESDELHKPGNAKGIFQKCLDALEPFKPDLTTTWIYGHLSFGVLMLLTLFASTVSFATILVTLSGVAWALMTWAPFSLVGEMIIRLNGNDTRPRNRRSSNAPYRGSYTPVSTSDDHHHQQQEMVEMQVSRTSLSSSVPPFSVSDLEAARRLRASPSGEGGRNGGEEEESANELSGIYLGILNIFACLPQMVGSFISFIIFSLLEPGKSPEFSGDEDVEAPTTGVNAIAVCLGIGGLCTLVAAHYTARFRAIYV